MKKIGLVLAGGKSTRMGEDKAGLILHAQTLLERQVTLLKSILPPENVYVSGTYDGYSCIEDLVTARGPLGGIFSTMQRFSKEKILLFVLPVDMPLLSSQTFARLIDIADENPEFDAYHFVEFEMPLALRNSDTLYSVLSGMLKENSNHSSVSVRNLLNHLKTLEVKRDNTTTNQFENLNTRPDYEKAVLCER